MAVSRKGAVLPIQLEAFAADLAEIKREYATRPGPEDLAHLRKMARWTRACELLGLATAWIAPNPISIALISTGRFARWTMLSHHVVHQGYDRVPEVPERYTSARWASGWHRLRDWPDWMFPDAWRQEHNVMHHYRLGEVADPDLVEHRAWLLRDPRLPRPLKLAMVALTAAVWKPLYYAPTTARALHQHEERKAKRADQEVPVDFWWDWLPTQAVGRAVWARSWLPYIALHFVAIPAAFLLIGPWAAFSVLVNTLLAEVLTNLHAFLVVAPNHAGDDLWRFDEPFQGKHEFLLRQVVGSVNYPCGDDRTDFLHGWLNYQIEHHLFPNASMLQLRRMQPAVKAVCEKHGVPYVQESTWTRLGKLVDVMTGRASMRRLGVGESLVERLGEA